MHALGRDKGRVDMHRHNHGRQLLAQRSPPRRREGASGVGHVGPCAGSAGLHAGVGGRVACNVCRCMASFRLQGEDQKAELEENVRRTNLSGVGNFVVLEWVKVVSDIHRRTAFDDAGAEERVWCRRSRLSKENLSIRSKVFAREQHTSASFVLGEVVALTPLCEDGPPCRSNKRNQHKKEHPVQLIIIYGTECTRFWIGPKRRSARIQPAGSSSSIRVRSGSRSCVRVTHRRRGRGRSMPWAKRTTQIHIHHRRGSPRRARWRHQRSRLGALEGRNRLDVHANRGLSRQRCSRRLKLGHTRRFDGRRRDERGLLFGDDAVLPDRFWFERDGGDERRRTRSGGGGYRRRDADGARGGGFGVLFGFLFNGFLFVLIFGED
jgi:hypothetical protein